MYTTYRWSEVKTMLEIIVITRECTGSQLYCLFKMLRLKLCFHSSCFSTRCLASLTIFLKTIWTLINKDKASKGRGEETRTVTTVSDSAPTNPLTPKYEDVGVSKTQIVQLTYLAGVFRHSIVLTWHFDFMTQIWSEWYFWHNPWLLSM